MLVSLLGEPLALPRLLELRRRVGDCARRLGHALAALAAHEAVLASLAQPAADGTFETSSGGTSGAASDET